MSRERVIRKTSIEAYKKLVAGGILPKRRAKAYRSLYDLRNSTREPATAGEVSAHMWTTYGVQMSANNCSRRLSELCLEGRAEEVGEDKCKISGFPGNTYDVTGEEGWYVQHSKSRGPKKVEAVIKTCPECPMLEVMVDGDEEHVRCWADKKATPQEDRRGDLCPMNTKKFLLIGG